MEVQLVSEPAAYQDGQKEDAGLVNAQQRLRALVLDTVASPHSRRNYAKALDDLFAFSAGRPLTRALLLGYRASIDTLAASTINVRLSAIRKLVGEARRLGLVGVEEAANLSDIPNIRKRDYVIVALLVGCALRRTELAELEVSTIQLRENRWVLADLEGKGRRIRTVGVPVWVKQGINAWMTAAKIEEGRLLRSIRKGGKVGASLSDWAVWSVVEQSAKQIGIEHFGAHDLRRTCAKLCRKSGGDLEQIKFLLGHSSIQTTERYLGSEQEIAIAVNDSLGL